MRNQELERTIGQSDFRHSTLESRVTEHKPRIRVFLLENYIAGLPAECGSPYGGLLAVSNFILTYFHLSWVRKKVFHGWRKLKDPASIQALPQQVHLNRAFAGSLGSLLFPVVFYWSLSTLRAQGNAADYIPRMQILLTVAYSFPLFFAGWYPASLDLPA